jgi:hypothetical protein
MAFRVTREQQAFIALALATAGLAACDRAPTAPSSPSTDHAQPAAVPASASAAPAATAGTQASAAKTIKITQGTLSLQTLQPGSVALQGSHGFRFDGRVQSGLEPSAYCSPFDPCQPGTTLPFTATWVGTDIPGTVRLQGDEFPVGSLDTGSLYIELSGSFVAPAHLTPTVSVTVPFTASGLLTLGHPHPQLTLTGGGQVTFTLEWQSAIGGWAIRFSSFDFGGGRPD